MKKWVFIVNIIVLTSTLYADLSFQVNGQDADVIYIPVGTTGTISLASDDSSSYESYVGFNQWDPSGSYSPYVTGIAIDNCVIYPEAGPDAYYIEDVYGYTGYYQIGALDWNPDDTLTVQSGVHFTFDVSVTNYDEPASFILLYDDWATLLDTIIIIRECQAEIALDRTHIDFVYIKGEEYPATETFNIWSDCSFNAIEWEIVNSCNWLDVSPLTGISDTEYDEVMVSVDPCGLSTGLYYYDLLIYDPNASNSPQSVSVELEVIGPVIELSQTSYSFVYWLGDPIPDDQILSIRNSALGALNWQITEACSWLDLTPTTGTSTGEW
ncbi:MAG: hypothetical protein JW860_16420, partial [Sedimentisphaerales bacterium]|nr:hypothetical protein [Sedimentisphaerales bacterium]